MGLPWTYFMNCSSEFCLDKVLFDLPVTLIVPEAEGVAPVRSSDLILFTTTYGGIFVLKALPDHRTVMVPDIPQVTNTGVTYQQQL